MAFLNSHLSTTALTDLADKLLPPGADSQTHLKTCRHCAGELARLEKALGLMRRDDSRQTPPAALRFAVELFRANRTGFAARTGGAVQKIRATLKSQISRFAPAFGERSANQSGEQQILFAAGDFDIDLRIRQTARGAIVSGQILGDLTGTTFIELESAEFSQTAEINDDGEFEFPPAIAAPQNFQVSLVFSN